MNDNPYASPVESGSPCGEYMHMFVARVSMAAFFFAGAASEVHDVYKISEKTGSINAMCCLGLMMAFGTAAMGCVYAFLPTTPKSREYP